MKKKVALLLALIMIVSMLPMNAITVFGTETPSVTRVLGTVRNNNDLTTHDGAPALSSVRNIEFTLPLSVFAGHNVNDLRLRIFTHGDAHFVATASTANTALAANPASGAALASAPWNGSITAEVTAAGGGPTGANTDANRNNWRWSNYEIQFGGIGTDFPMLSAVPTADRYIQLTVPVLVWGNNARVSAEILLLGTAQLTPMLGETSIVNELREYGEIAITSGAPRNFTHDLHLPNITIAERYMRVLGVSGPPLNTPHEIGTGAGQLIAIQLIAPRGFSWAAGPVAGVGDPFNVINTNGSFSINAAGSHGNNIAVRHGANDRHVLIVYVNQGRIGAGVGPDQIIIQNAWLRPEDYDATRQGNVNIEVRVGTATSTEWDQNRPTGWTQNFDRNIAGVTNTALHVGTAAGNDLYFRTVGDVPSLRSGLDAIRHNVNREEDITTATVQLSELIRGSWGSSAFSATEFYFGPGVQIIDAEVRVSRGSTTYRTNNDYQIIVPVEFDTDLELQADDVRGFTIDTSVHSGAGSGATAQRYEGGRIRITPETLSINLPLDPRPNRDRYYHMQVQFRLSVEAGFEARHGNEIEVFMRGNAINNSDAARSAVVAYVYDPITVELDGNPVTMQLGGLANTMEHIQIPNIVIRETDGGMLRRGDVLDVTAAAIPIAVLGNLTLSGTQVSIDDDSGLTLNVVSQTGPGGGVRLVVTRESRENTPATITLSNNHYLGLVMPGVQYVVAVQNPGTQGGLGGAGTGTGTMATSDPGVAENTFLNLPSDRVGLFSNIAYYVQIIDFEAAEGGIAVNPGVGPGRPAFSQLVLREGARAWSTSDNAYVENALMLWSNPADGNVVSMLNPRIFADFIGGDIEWVEATQTVTFSGPDSNGSPVTVVLQVGSNTATINGVTHDIASFSGSGPANSVSTIISADRTFVPLRFLANAFL
jgi:hypothetical protein